MLSNKMKNEESEPTAFSNTGTLNRDSFSGVMGQRPECRRLKSEVGSEEIECYHSFKKFEYGGGGRSLRKRMEQESSVSKEDFFLRWKRFPHV